MVSNKDFNININPSRLFISDIIIKSKSYCRVFLNVTGDGDWVIVNEDTYDLINNTIVFDEPPIGELLSIHVATTPSELPQSPTTDSILLAIKDKIVTVANNFTSVVSVADNLDELLNINSSIPIIIDSMAQVEVDRVAVANNKSTVETLASQVATDKIDVEADRAAVANNKSTVETLASQVATDKIDVEADRVAVANNKSTVETLASQVATDKIDVEADRVAVSNNKATVETLASQVATDKIDVEADRVAVSNDKATVETLASQVAIDKIDVEADKNSVSIMKSAVESIYDSFDDRFLGAKTSNPTVDNDGNPLLDGALYFNSSARNLRVYSLTDTTWYVIPQLYLSGLLDVQLTSITTGDILNWNGAKWVNTRTPKFSTMQLTGGTGTEGTLSWNTDEGTVDIVLPNGSVLQVGQEGIRKVRNSTASIIPNGTVVMFDGTIGNSGRIKVKPFTGGFNEALYIYGITTQDIVAGADGIITTEGKIRGINTTGSSVGETWLDGDILYAKPNNAGSLTKVVPSDSQLKTVMASVIKAHTSGTLELRFTPINENTWYTKVQADNLLALKINKVTSTDNAIVRFHGITGEVQNSNAILDDIGNLALRATDIPNTSASSMKYLQLGNNTFLINNGNGSYITTNAIHNGTAWKYVSNGSASIIDLSAGTCLIYTAVSGTAGATIPWVQAVLGNTVTNSENLDGYNLDANGVPLLRGFAQNGLHSQYTGNLNDIVINSMYNIDSETTTNMPSDFVGWGFLQTMLHCNGSTYATQVCYSMTAGDGKVFIRHKAGTWRSWVRLLTNSNEASSTIVIDGTPVVNTDTKAYLVKGTSTSPSNDIQYDKPAMYIEVNSNTNTTANSNWGNTKKSGGLFIEAKSWSGFSGELNSAYFRTYTSQYTAGAENTLVGMSAIAQTNTGTGNNSANVWGANIIASQTSGNAPQDIVGIEVDVLHKSASTASTNYTGVWCQADGTNAYSNNAFMATQTTQSLGWRHVMKAYCNALTSMIEMKNGLNSAGANGMVLGITYGAENTNIINAYVGADTNPSFKVTGDASYPVWIKINGVLKKVYEGANDSAGAGYKILKVVN